MDQFDAGDPWDVVTGSAIEGGHYVPIVGRNSSGNFLCVTWGKVQEVTPAFLLKYVDEAVAYVSLEALKDGTSLEGLNVTQLQADLNALGSGTTPTPGPAPAPTPTPAPLNVDTVLWTAVRGWVLGRHSTAATKAVAAALKAWATAHGLT